MFKLILTQQLLPGKLPAFKAWTKRVDQARAKQDPKYKPPKRYMTVYGMADQIVLEFEMEKLPEPLGAFADQAPEGLEKEGVDMVLPGTREVRLLREF